MRLAILGASGHGKVVADAAECSGWQEIVFFDDAWPKVFVNGSWRVQGDTAALLEDLNEFDGVVVGIGDNAIRGAKQSRLSDAGANIVSIIHPAATVSGYARVCAGSVVFANAAINACASVGLGVIVNTGAVIEHDCMIGDFAHVSPNAVLAGGVILKEQSWVGACASVRQLLEIGEAAVVGMGAVVTKNVPDRLVVAGNPAKALHP